MYAPNQSFKMNLTEMQKSSKLEKKKSILLRDFKILLSVLYKITDLALNQQGYSTPEWYHQPT